MKIAIMQPYLFPYLGYFQLIRAVDAFVVYDDVNFINRGWINRNYILGNGEKQRITLPLRSASQNKHINQIEIAGPHKILKNIRHGYAKAPHFANVYPVLEDIFAQTDKNLARFLDYQLRHICDHLGLRQQWYRSSALAKDNGLSGQDKILSICEELGATHYINVPGGKELYDQYSFEARGMTLSFIQPKPATYKQFTNDFIPSLSIIDVMMFNDKSECAVLLDNYDLA